MAVPDARTLLEIIARARSGSHALAWRMFVEGGYAAITEDPAVLAVKGRLLKDQAARASGDDRRRLLLEAAAAYARAAETGNATYPLINAATLWLLAGDASRSRELARQVITRVDTTPDEPETPYYRAATRAEALMLLGRIDDAQSMLAEAIGLAPRAWEDHASTLRQLALILAAQGEDDGWLDPLRPPRSLHFGGHMSFYAEARSTPLTGKIAAVLAEERIGFGYGALAAGADILVAEALLAYGAELHLVIPGGMEAFAALSVDPFGAEWRRRFDAVYRRAETIRDVAPVGVQPDLEMITLAEEIAMGAALGNARRLASEAVQLLVLDDTAEVPGNRSATPWSGTANGRRQRILVAAREDVGTPSAVASAGVQRGLATLAIHLLTSDESAGLQKIKAMLDQGATPAIPASFTGEVVLISYQSTGAAAEAATALIGALAVDIAVGGHYGICDVSTDPFSGGARVTGRTLAIVRAAAVSALPGTVCVTEDFATALEVADSLRFQSELIGELIDPETAAPIGLHALGHCL